MEKQMVGILAGLLCLAAVAPARASVVLMTGNYSFDPLPDMPADFGPRVPAEGVEGILVVANPEDACTNLSVPVLDGNKPWIALIMRSERAKTECSFDVKVRHAEEAGAAGAIVYDDVYEALIIMSKPRDHPEPGIPAVFVAQKTGIVMKKLMTPASTLVRITPIADAVWMSMLLSAFAGVLAVTVVVATFYFISGRRARMRSLPGRLGYSLLGSDEEGMSPAELRALPIVIHERHHHARASARREDSPVDLSDVEAGALSSASSDSGASSPRGAKGGGTLRTCAVCIEDYRDGEKLRVLPCKHRFHLECIDQWLSARKPLCPICKWDALQPFPSLTPDQDAGLDESAAATPSFFFRPHRWRWTWSRPQPISRNEGGTGGPTGGPGGAAAAMERAGSSAEGAGAGGGGFGTAGAGAVGLSTTPTNFPGMHAVRRSADGSGGGGEAAGEAETLSQVVVDGGASLQQQQERPDA